MREIREIISAIEDRFNYRDIDWTKFSETLSPNQERLLTLLRETDYDDNQITTEVYQSDPRDEQYRRDKLIIIEHLSNVLCRTKRNSYSTKLAGAHALVFQRFHCMSILRIMGYTSAATWYAEINIKQAIRYELTYIVCDTARYLARVYSVKLHNPQRFRKYTAIAKTYVEVQQVEHSVEILYNEIGLLTKQKTIIGISDLSEFNQPFNTAVAERSYFYLLYHGLTSIHRAELCANHEQVITLSHFYFQQLEKKKYNHRIAKGIFLRAKVGAQLQLGQYVNAQKTLDILVPTLPPSSNNWFNTQDMQIRLSLATQDYTAAYEQLQDLLDNKRYRAQPQEHKDLYQLYAVYINFLVFTGNIPESRPWTKNKLTTYFRTKTVFDRDTHGVRIAMIIVELLYNILDHDYDAMESRIYNLKQYCSKYLKKDKENYRSNCFIKMLLEIPKALFHPEATQRRAKRYHKGLLDNPLELSLQPREVEIIPYEHLWTIILQYLRQPRRRRPHAMDVSEFDL